MVDKTQHLRERFYRRLRPEIHQRLTPSYEDGKTPYVVLLKRARQLEEEYSPQVKAEARGARDDPQMRNVIKTLKEIKEQIQYKEDPTPNLRRSGKECMVCYYCGEPGHWRRTCPQRPQRKRKVSSARGGSSTSPETSADYCVSNRRNHHSLPGLCSGYHRISTHPKLLRRIGDARDFKLLRVYF